MYSNAALRRLLVPLVLEQILLMLVGIVGTIMVSSAGEAAMSGVALVDMVNYLIITVMVSLATGGAVIVSQYLGSRDAKRANQTAGQLVTITLLISTAIMILCLLLHRVILRALFRSVDDAVMQAAITYFWITALSFPFLGLYNSAAALFRSMQKTQVTMYVSLLMNVINVLGSYIGVFVLHAGVAGVAFPALISRAVAALVMVALAFRKSNAVSVRWSAVLAWNRATIARILRIAVPNGIENGLFALGRVLVTVIVSQFGTAHTAANGVANSVDMIAIIVVNSINLGILTVVGQLVGARAYDEARTNIKKLMLISYVSTACLSLIVWALLPQLLGFYHLSPETYRLTYLLVLIHNFSAFALHPTSFNLPNALRAAGDARYTMHVGILSMLVLRLGSGYLFGIVFNLGVVGVWIAMCMDWLGRSAAFALRFRSGKWKEYRAI